jgi:hypothetical protein
MDVPFHLSSPFTSRGYFWGDRFKSVIVDKGETLVNCLAYIDLNPLRAGMVDRPEEYRWNSLGYHLQTENKDQFLSTDFGLKESILLETRKKTKADQRFGWDVFLEEIGGELIFSFSSPIPDIVYALFLFSLFRVLRTNEARQNELFH